MIVQVARRLPPFAGGTEQQAIKLAHALNLSGHTAIVLGGRIPGTITADDVVLLPDSSLRFWGTIKFHLCLLHWLEKHRRDIQVVQTFFLHETTLLLAWWCKFRRIPLFFKLATSGRYGDFEAARNSWRSKWALRAIRKHATGVVAISRQLSKEASDQGFRTVHHIPNGVPVPPHAPVSRSGPGIRLAAVGRLAPQKAFDQAIRAVAQVNEIAGLDIFGEGNLMQELAALAEAEGCSEKVHFRGWCGDVSARLASYDAVLISSLSEGLSNVMLEAMAAGVPVITTPVSGAADAITDGQTGIIASGFEAEDLACALRRFLAELAAQKDLPQRIRDSLGETFDIQAVARQYLSIYFAESS